MEISWRRGGKFVKSGGGYRNGGGSYRSDNAQSPRSPVPILAEGFGGLGLSFEKRCSEPYPEQSRGVEGSFVYCRLESDQFRRSMTWSRPILRRRAGRASDGSEATLTCTALLAVAVRVLATAWIM